MAAFLLATSLYALHGDSWLMFVTLFLVPDASFAGYLAGTRVGAAIHNVVHSYVGPLILAATILNAGAGSDRRP
jgi:hypothetical protein